MQAVVVFAALFAVAMGQTVVHSNRLGGNFAYSVHDNKWAVAPATTWTAPVATYAANWAAPATVYNNWNGAVVAPVVARSSVVASGTPASTYKTIAGVSPIHYNTHGVTAYNWPTHQTLGYQWA